MDARQKLQAPLLEDDPEGGHPLDSQGLSSHSVHEGATTIIFSAATLVVGIFGIIIQVCGVPPLGGVWGPSAPTCSLDNDVDKLGCQQYFTFFGSIFLALGGFCGIIAGIGPRKVGYGAAVCAFITAFFHLFWMCIKASIDEKVCYPVGGYCWHKDTESNYVPLQFLKRFGVTTKIYYPLNFFTDFAKLVASLGFSIFGAIVAMDVKSVSLKTYVAGIVCVTYFFAQIDVYDTDRFVNQFTSAVPSEYKVDDSFSPAWWLGLDVATYLFLFLGALVGLVQVVMDISPTLDMTGAGILGLGCLCWLVSVSGFVADSGQPFSVPGHHPGWSDGVKAAMWFGMFVDGAALPLALAAILLSSVVDFSGILSQKRVSTVRMTQDMPAPAASSVGGTHFAQQGGYMSTQSGGGGGNYMGSQGHKGTQKGFLAT